MTPKTSPMMTPKYIHKIIITPNNSLLSATPPKNIEIQKFEPQK